MNHLKKILLGLMATVALTLIGASTAAAQCSASPVGTAPNIRAEGTVELVGVITIPCGAATGGGLIAGASNIAITVSPSATRITAGAGGQCTLGGSPAAYDLKSTFPCPSVNQGGAAIAGASATISGNTILFNFTPAACAAGSGAVCTITITGIRVSAASSGLGIGGALQAAVARGGVGFIGKSDNVLVAFTNNTLTSASGFGTTALAVPACGPAVPTPLGSPSTLPANPDLSLGQSNSLKLTLANGFLGSFSTIAASDGGFAFAPPVGGLAGGQGMRMRVLLTGIPAGISIYAPEQISGLGPSPAGAVVAGVSTNGAGVAQPNSAPIAGASFASTGSSNGTSVLTLVGTGPALDGSGGAILAAPVVNQYDLIAPSGGTVVIVYEVTTASSLAAIDTVVINIAVTGTGSVGTGAITGVVGPGPVGPPTANTAVPQFAAPKGSVVINVALCASYLIFPWVVNTGDGQYDTGLTVSNTTADPAVIGTTGQTGDVTLYFFPSDGSAPFSQSLQTGVKPGQTATFVVSSGLKKTFTGYVFAVCSFNLAHGVEFIVNPIAGGNGFAQGYAAISVSNPRIPSATTPPIESRGN